MNFVLLEDYIDVQSFNICKRNLSCIGSKGLLVNNELIEPNTNTLGVFLTKDLYTFSDNKDYNTYILNLRTSKISNIGQVNIQGLIYEDAFLAYQYDESFNSEAHLINQKDFRLIRSLNIKNKTFRYIWKKYGLYNSSTSIYSLDIEVNTIQWEYSLSEIVKDGVSIRQHLEVEKLLGIYKECIWSILDNGFILGVDLISGKLKHYIGIAEDCPQEQRQLEREGIAYISQNYKLDEKAGEIILLSDTNYFEIDLNNENPVKKWKDLSQEMQKHELICEMGGNDGFQFDDRYFYFYDGPKGKIAVMDRRSFEIVWTQNLDIQTDDEFVLSLLRDMKVSEGNLYILDRNQTLHVFENES